MTPICFYHRADFDGVCSAAIAKKFVPDCELFGIDYGDEFPWAKVQPAMTHEVLPTRYKFDGKTVVDATSGSVSYSGKRAVYMVDFSLKPDEMKRLNEVSDLIWIDHHKSALDALAHTTLAGCRCSPSFAACELCWRWFAGKGYEVPLPEAVRLLGRYDVWDAQNPEWARIEAFQFGMRSLPATMDPSSSCGFCWNDLLSGGLSCAAIADRGYAILSYRDQEAKSLCADGAQEFCAFRTGLGTFNWFFGDDCAEVLGRDDGKQPFVTGVALNSLSRGSWQFNSVYDPEKHDAMCVYGRLKNGKYRVSLYSTKEEVDCGAICKALGGGGHKGAAGFICDKLPWE